MGAGVGVVGALEGDGVGLGCGLAGGLTGGRLAVDDGPATVGRGERRGRGVGSIRSAHAARAVASAASRNRRRVRSESTGIARPLADYSPAERQASRNRIRPAVCKAAPE
jgi:hypothetical protein